MDLMGMIRGIVYLWVGLEALSNLQIYIYGYRNQKKSPIIAALMLIFITIGVLSFYLFACAIIRALKPNFYNDITFWGPLFILPVGYSLDRFRRESLVDNSKKEKK